MVASFLSLYYGIKLADVITGAALDTHILVNSMGLPLLPADSAGGAFPQASEAAFTLLWVNGILN
jgi:hypothetical protein